MRLISAIETKNKYLFALGTVVFILITIVLLFVYLARVQMPQKQIKTIKADTTLTQEKIPTPVPTQIPLDKTMVQLEVLNGSGISGAAGKAAASLQSLGYTNTTVGNADKLYDITTISVNSDLLSFKDEILKDVQSLYPKAELGDNLTTSNPNVRVVIGKDE